MFLLPWVPEVLSLQCFTVRESAFRLMLICGFGTELFIL
jgi:hypothetical protein